MMFRIRKRHLQLSTLREWLGLALPPVKLRSRAVFVIGRILIVLGAALLIFGLTPARLQAENSEISARRAEERRVFTDAEILEGFFKIAFGAELELAGRADRIRKFDAPVRIYIDNRAKPDRAAQVKKIIADIGKHIANLDIAVTGDRNAANVIVALVRDRDLSRTLREFYGRDRAQKIRHSLDPQCLSGFQKDESYRIVRSEVIIVVDAGDFIFYDCVYEELLQALGPINDDPSVPWTMFNDNVQLGFFGIYDQYLLNILYNPRIRPGMTREEAHAVVPKVLPAIRTFVERLNGPAPESFLSE